MALGSATSVTGSLIRAVLMQDFHMLRRFAAALLAWFACASVALATPAYVTSWVTDTAGPLTIAPTTGDGMCVWAFSSATGATITLSDGHNTYTNVPAATASLTAAGTLAAFYVQNASSAGVSLTASTTAGAITGIYADEYSGIATTGALDGTGAEIASQSYGGSSPVTTSSFAITAGDLVCGWWASGGTTFGVGPGFTITFNDSANGQIGEYLVNGSASAAITGAYTGTSLFVWLSGFALKPSGAGASCSLTRSRMGVGC